MTALLTALSLAQSAPLVARFGSAIAGDLGDPLLNTWILWWNAQRVPFTGAYWNAPAFAPAPNAFALSETLLGLTWLTSPLQWIGASPAAAYDAMFIIAPVLNGLSAFWLCLTLTGRRDAALIGSLALAFAPYQASQVSHLQNMALFFMPIALVGLHRYWRSGDRWWLALFTASIAMNGLACGYFLIYFSVLVGLATMWLAISSRDLRKLAATACAFGVALIALSPVILKYQSVQRFWNLHRALTEIEFFSADLSSMLRGSRHLLLWPSATLPHQAELAAYPGVAITLLILAGIYAAARHCQPAFASPRWRTVLVSVLAGLSLMVGLAGCVLFWQGEQSYKVFGIAVDLAVLSVIVSPRFTHLLRTGSLFALYFTGAVAAYLLSLGPVGHVFGHRFWYKAPFAWLITAPGFDSVRVPARFSAIEALCLSVMAALAVTRIWPQVTKVSVLAIAAVAVAIVLDGWAIVPVVATPPMLTVPVHADLVVELPMRDVMDDVAAMYRGTTHGRPVINGYSGYFPPGYVQLQKDLRRGCVNSLEALREGRSVDAVIWRDRGDAVAIDIALRELWSGAEREEAAATIIYHQPRVPSSTDPATTSCRTTSGRP